MTWISNQNGELKNTLLNIYSNRSQGKQYYVRFFPFIKNPEFKNESSYINMPFPDVGFRLLSLYRYWNIINYFFPYKHLMDDNWNAKLKEFIPEFINAQNELDYELAVLQLIGSIQDTHANLWSGADKIEIWKGKNFAPVHVRFVENKLIVIDYYQEKYRSESHLKTGDIISKINGQPVDEIVEEKSKNYPASNNAVKLRDMSKDLLRSNNQTVEIEYISDGISKKTSLKLYPRTTLKMDQWYEKKKGKSFEMLNDNIGFITLETIQKEDISKIKNEFQNAKGIIIDMRNYPSTFVPYSLGSYFVSSSAPFALLTSGNPDNPGEFNFTKTLKVRSKGKTFKEKVVVLVNEYTQSQAEFTAMAFRAGDNITIIGSTTAGADGNVSKILLPGGAYHFNLRNWSQLSEWAGNSKNRNHSGFRDNANY